jgi:hypothetical protein
VSFRHWGTNKRANESAKEARSVGLFEKYCLARTAEWSSGQVVGMRHLVSHTTCGTSQLFFHLGVPVNENAGSYVTLDVGYPEILHNSTCFDMCPVILDPGALGRNTGHNQQGKACIRDALPQAGPCCVCA